MNLLPKKTSVDEEPVERLFNFRPVLCSAVFLCLGILFSYIRELNGVSAIVALLPLGVLLCAFPLTNNKKKTLFAVLALAISFFIGTLCFSLNLSSYRRIDAVDGYYTVTGRITEKELGGERCKLRIEEVTLDGNRVNGAVIAYTPASIAGSLQLSDRVEFYTYIQVNVQAFDKYGFRAEAIAENSRFLAGTVSTIRVTGHQTDLFLAARQRIGETVQKGMDKTPAAVTLAVLLGDVSAMDEGLLENVRYGGIAHIFAVSGLHIGTLFGLLTTLIKKTKLQRFPKAVRWGLAACLLLFYGGICGYSASVVRATVTCLALYMYRLMGEKTDSLETISFAAVCVLLFQPTQLFAVGFQLSFAACYGIAFLSRPLSMAANDLMEKAEAFVLQKLCKRPPPLPVDLFERDVPPPSLYVVARRSVISFLSVSISAQAFTFPVLLLSFGYVSNAGLLLNCLFVPLLSAAFCPLLVFVMAACLIAAWETIVLFIPNVVLSAVLLFFQTLDFSIELTQGLALSAGAVVAYYAALLFCSDKCNVAKKQKLLLIGIFAVAFGISFATLNL